MSGDYPALEQKVGATAEGLLPTGGREYDLLRKRSQTDYDAEWGNVTGDAIFLSSDDGLTVWESFNNSGPHHLRGNAVYFIYYANVFYTVLVPAGGHYGASPGTPLSAQNFKFLFPISGGGLPLGGGPGDVMVKNSIVDQDVSWSDELDDGDF